jgi:hypothetical protein
MSSCIRVRSCLLLLVMTPALMEAQERNLKGVLPLHVSVHVADARVVGDTTTIDYMVENVRAGGEDFWGLLVATPATVVRMPAPATLQWGIHPQYRKQPIVGWMLYEDTLVRPGHTTPPLRLVARGIPDIVRYWAVPDLDANPPVASDVDDGSDDYITFSDSGVTVGVVPVASGATSAGLAARLRTLLGRSCQELGWISQNGVCHSLDVKLANAQDAIAGGDLAQARNVITAFANELDAQHGDQPGKHVNDSAYALLSANASYLLSRL